MAVTDKIIFLDLDGVMNTLRHQRQLMYEGKVWEDRHGAFFDPVAVAQLRRIIDATHAAIVIESSWKCLGLEAMQRLWHARRMPGEVIDVTPSGSVTACCYQPTLTLQTRRCCIARARK